MAKAKKPASVSDNPKRQSRLILDEKSRKEIDDALDKFINLLSTSNNKRKYNSEHREEMARVRKSVASAKKEGFTAVIIRCNFSQKTIDKLRENGYKVREPEDKSSRAHTISWEDDDFDSSVYDETPM